LIPNELPTNAQTTDTTETEPSPTQKLFNAVSACANLHPDPVGSSSEVDGEEDDLDVPVYDYEVVNGLPPPIPGSSGWITADNMDQFFDEDGNWRAGGLGPGAGLVRERDNEASEEESSINGTDETKWRRTG
jgi:chloride channel, nucleotide-sensitive, 1A